MWKIVGGVLLVLLLMVLFAPVCLRLRYRGNLVFTVRVWGIPVYRFPGKRKVSFPHEKAVPDKPGAPQQQSWLSQLASRLKTDGVGATLAYLQQTAALIGSAVRRLLGAITVDRFELHLWVASCDAATTAQDTGRVCAVLYPALTAIQRVIRIRRRAVTVTPDFLAESGRAEVDLRVHTVPLCVLWAAIRTVLSYGIRRFHKAKTAKEELQHGASSTGVNGGFH